MRKRSHNLEKKMLSFNLKKLLQQHKNKISTAAHEVINKSIQDSSFASIEQTTYLIFSGFLINNSERDTFDFLRHIKEIIKKTKVVIIQKNKFFLL